MEFVNPWGLLGLISLPTIAAIHLFHRRHPPLYVAGVHLWGVENRLQSAGRRKDRLPITSTLLLELLAALLLTLILSQPRIKDWQGVVHLVVVLDQSASMQGQPADGPDFRTAAANRLKQEFESRGRNCVASLICTGRRPAMLAGPAVDWEEAFAALKDWRPEQPEHDFRPAWDLARQLAENTGEMIFLTDHLPAADAPLPKGMRVISVGRGLDNVAVTNRSLVARSADVKGQGLFADCELWQRGGRSGGEGCLRGDGPCSSKRCKYDRRRRFPWKPWSPAASECCG